ncbi:CGNR zinc finger domain-containing protein [Labrys sp. ZIDIC5]|uniref:CGNR zinc finger domain-containing protein n=1 Tax=Labrys sedimenti TaxID=3106036 RepID=UPI002ACA51F7|nr:CGNR zinc finger domain-containing protein [Labrys sp. ZIDIC5]MDZ5450115.1 CGNR zinc finger domain-containing protein [Labrys sp. ZIDIC5]
MSQVKTIAAARLVGGHPALDFVNTVDAWRDRWGPDLLVSYGDLVTWALRVDLVDSALSVRLLHRADTEPAVAEAALLRARTLRVTLRNLFLAEALGETGSEEDAARLDAVLQDANRQRELRLITGTFEWGWRDDNDLDTVLHRIAFAAAELLTSRNDRRDVRECHGINCGWLFLDTSRGGRRQWCSEEACGTHMRVRRFREKGSPAA